MQLVSPGRLSLGVTLVLLAGCPSSGGSGGGTTSTGAAGNDGTGTAASTTSTSTAEAPTTEAPTTGAPSDGDPFSVTVLDRAWLSGKDGWNTQHQDVAYDLGPGSFARVTLVVDLESDCYPWDKWQQNPPPAGQNWPASCDAFDRTVGFVSDPAAGADDPPGFELLRSITPFGGPAHLEADITDYANAHPGAHTLRSYILSWSDGQGKVSGSDGGWHLSVRIDVEPGPAPREVLAAIPLFAGDIGVDEATQTTPFTLPDGVSRADLVYIVSGHGGASDPSSDCIGPAEEFCKRTHHVRLDGVDVTSFAAWRTDCGELCTVTDNPLPVGPTKFCQENPCGAIASVQAARANWCPGAQVAPLRGPIRDALGPGPDHELQFAIDDVFPGGIWTVSAAVYAYAD